MAASAEDTAVDSAEVVVVEDPEAVVVEAEEVVEPEAEVVEGLAECDENLPKVAVHAGLSPSWRRSVQRALARNCTRAHANPSEKEQKPHAHATQETTSTPTRSAQRARRLR